MPASTSSACRPAAALENLIVWLFGRGKRHGDDIFPQGGGLLARSKTAREFPAVDVYMSSIIQFAGLCSGSLSTGMARVW